MFFCSSTCGCSSRIDSRSLRHDCGFFSTVKMIDRADLVVKNEKVAYDSSQEPFYKHMLLKEVLVLPAKGQKAAHVQVEAEKKKT